MRRRLFTAGTNSAHQQVASEPSSAWCRTAVVYQVYLRSFADSNGDGIGDLAGVRSRLPYLSWLGVDALWINPHYPSGGADGGYDVVDYRAVDPDYGDVADVEALVADARRLGLRVLLDVVPNHTSDRHPWFQAALADPDSPEAARYHFAPPSDEPPNNWQSLFGGTAWSRTPDGRWYLHLFAPEQPDLNWRDPAVAADFEQTLRFWLDRGVNGFRVDVAYGLFKDAGLRDNPGGYSPTLFGHGPEQAMTWNQPEVHDVWRRWRSICDEYPDTMLVGEVCLADLEQVALYSRPDELHQSLPFRLLKSPRAGAPVPAALAGGAADPTSCTSRCRSGCSSRRGRSRRSPRRSPVRWTPTAGSARRCRGCSATTTRSGRSPASAAARSAPPGRVPRHC